MTIPRTTPKPIRLRAVDPDDLEELLAWRNDPDIRMRCREFKPLTWAHQEQWFTGLAGKKYPDDIMYVVEADGGVGHQDAIGIVGLCHINWKDRHAEVSFLIGHKDYQRQGYAVRAMEQLVEYAFKEVGLHRLWAECYAFNKPGMKVLERLKFKQEGMQRQAVWVDGQWHDAVLYGLLREDMEE